MLFNFLKIYYVHISNINNNNNENNNNKNTLAGPANCKETTRNHPHLPSCGKLIMQSRENGQKPQCGQFFDDFKFKYLQIAFFLLKNRFHSN